MCVKKEKIYPAYVSKLIFHNSNRKKTCYSVNNFKWKKTMALSCSIYLKLSALLREITSKPYGEFYCLNCFHSFRTKRKFESHKKVKIK